MKKRQKNMTKRQSEENTDMETHAITMNDCIENLEKDLEEVIALVREYMAEQDADKTMTQMSPAGKRRCHSDSDEDSESDTKMKAIGKRCKQIEDVYKELEMATG